MENENKKKNCNIKNLRVPTSEQARENGRKGGLASAAAYKKRKLIAETLKTYLSLPDEEKPGQSNLYSMVEAIGREAKSGNVRAFEVVRDTTGEKPADKLDANVNGFEPIKINIVE